MGPPTRSSSRLVLVVLLAVCGYSWWFTGLRPFTTTAYLALGLPVVALVAVMVIASRLPDHVSAEHLERHQSNVPALNLHRLLPWVTILLIAIGLEVAGLALGGRSKSVPTVSTVIDHALAWHGVRFLLFGAWLTLGSGPAVSLWRRLAGKEA